MRRVLFVAESFGVAKTLGKMLSKGHLRHSVTPPYSQFSMNFQGKPTQVSLTYIGGHLMKWDFSRELNNYWRMDKLKRLFDAPLRCVLHPAKQKMIDGLKEHAKNASTLVIWTDCDREGERIGDEIKIICRQGNPNIEVYRARFSEITESSIQSALDNPGQLDNNIVEAVNCRAQLDLRVGSAFTCLQTLFFRQNYPDTFPRDTPTQLVSYGPCQFPTLGFVVEREKAIQQFVAKPFWKLQIDHVKDGVKTTFARDGGDEFDPEKARKRYEKLHGDCQATVEVCTFPVEKPRPLALSTVEFLKLTINNLQMSASEAMESAQRLYAAGFISYPRTETDGFPDRVATSLSLNYYTYSLSELDAAWGEFAAKMLENGGADPRNGDKTDNAHWPIHPLRSATRHVFLHLAEISNFREDIPDDNDWRVYEVIVRQFLACNSRDAVGLVTQATIRLGDESFTATGVQVEDPGFLAVYPYETWSEKSAGKYDGGETLNGPQVQLIDCLTEPPPLLTEADVITWMYDYGIGTDANYNTHIDKLKKRGYVHSYENGQLRASILGQSLIDAYTAMENLLAHPQLRAELEKDLQEISKGTKSKDQVLRKHLPVYRRLFRQTEAKLGCFKVEFDRHYKGALDRGDFYKQPAVMQPQLSLRQAH
ncbi:unnamed protein product, partial [Mesorhabditis spiculigera]